MVWSILNKFVKQELGQFGQKMPLNRQSQILVTHLLKSKKLRPLNIGMWGFYPEAMASNVSVLSLNFNFG